MAASITHLVIGERVFKQLAILDPAPSVFGPFLAGCAIVDVHALHDIDRRLTHFVGRVDTDGEDAYRKSCANFSRDLDHILKSRWSACTPAEQAFVIGYLCHLAVDECWKELGVQWFQKLAITSYKDFPIHPDVMLTAFDYLSRGRLMEPAAVFSALAGVEIPDVFCHVDHEIFCHQWELIQPYLNSDGTQETYMRMLRSANRLGDIDRIETDRRFDRWVKAIDLIQSIGGEMPFIENATNHSLEVIRGFRPMGI
jgi:hypothetical protein